MTALGSILGEGASGLSATNIVRLKAHWEAEYKGWATRDLSGKEYVYLWADGVYFNVRLEDERSCILVIMGCNLKGEKELLAISDGFRESELSWLEMLRDLKGRGLKIAPKLAIGDGALGFWAALGQGVFRDPVPALLGAQDGQRAQTSCRRPGSRRPSR